MHFPLHTTRIRLLPGGSVLGKIARHAAATTARIWMPSVPGQRSSACIGAQQRSSSPRARCHTSPRKRHTEQRNSSQLLQLGGIQNTDDSPECKNSRGRSASILAICRPHTDHQLVMGCGHTRASRSHRSHDTPRDRLHLAGSTHARGHTNGTSPPSGHRGSSNPHEPRQAERCPAQLPPSLRDHTLARSPPAWIR